MFGIKGYIYGSIGLAMIAGAVWLYNEGGENALDKVEEANREAQEAAIAAAADFRSCIDAGGLWDFGASECTGPAGNNR